MKLSKYLAENGLSQQEFGAKIGVKRLSIIRYLNGSRKPRPATATKIIKATKGAVTWEDLYK